MAGHDSLQCVAMDSQHYSDRIDSDERFRPSKMQEDDADNSLDSDTFSERSRKRPSLAQTSRGVFARYWHAFPAVAPYVEVLSMPP